MTIKGIQTVAISAPPQKLWKHELADIFAWYQTNLCEAELYDPRGHRLIFAPERFPHMIKLLIKGSDREVNAPQDVVKAIQNGTRGNADFGGYDAERAQTLTWIPQIIQQPSMILEVTEKTLWEKPGDTLYVKEFEKRGYRHKILVCRTVGEARLAPVTSHPRKGDRFSPSYTIVWKA